MENRMQEGAGRPLYSSAPQTDFPPRPAVPVRPSFTAAPAELWAALGSYLIGFLYMQLVLWVSLDTPRGWLVAFVLLFCAGTEWFCRAMGRRAVPSESWFWLVCLGLVALSIGLWGHNGRTVGGWDLLALHGLAVYWTLSRTGALAEGGTGPMIWLDLLRGFFSYPFGGFFLRIRTIACRVRRTRPGKRLPGVLIGLVAAVPLLLVAYELLTAVDGHFAALMRLTVDWSWLNGELVLRLLLSLPVGAWLYGLAASCLRNKQDTAICTEVRGAAEQLRVLPYSTICILLAALNGLYLIFFVLQGSYLLGGFFGHLPDGFTAAEYAVSGFEEVCRLMLLNMAVLGGCAKFSRTPLRRSRVLQALGAALCGFSLLFVAVAGAKLALYIGRFGLTPRRVLAAWFILVLGVWALIALFTLLRPIRAVRLAVWAAAAAFALLCLSHPDGWIVRGNISLYAHGVVDSLDADVIGQCQGWDNRTELAQPLLDCGWMLGRTDEELVDMLGYMGHSGSNTMCWPLDDGRQLTVTLDPSTGLSTRAEIR